VKRRIRASSLTAMLSSGVGTAVNADQIFQPSGYLMNPRTHRCVKYHDSKEVPL